VTIDDVAEARRAELAFTALSLDSPGAADDDPATIGDLLGAEDPQLEHVLDMQAVWTHWAGLPDRLQEILLMRFYGNMSQAEIATQLHISQMHVSRLLAAALGYLREQVDGAARAAAPRR
jgi:RNA polymerase sigma-B factor